MLIFSSKSVYFFEVFAVCTIKEAAKKTKHNRQAALSKESNSWFNPKKEDIMKRLSLYFVSILLIAVCGKVSAQEYLLNNTNHNKTKNTCSGYLYDNSKNGNYEASQDRWVTICPSGTTGNSSRISLTFEEFDIVQSHFFQMASF